MKTPKLAAIVKRHVDWRSRVGVTSRLFAAISDFLEGAYLGGYVQALIDHGLMTPELTAEIEERGLDKEIKT